MTTEATRITDQPLWWDIWDGRGPFFLVQMVLNPNLYEIFLVFPGSIGHIWLNITYLVQFYRIITNSVMKNVNRRTWCAIRSWRTLAEITIHDGLHSGKHQLIHGIFFYQLIYCFFLCLFFLNNSSISSSDDLPICRDQIQNQADGDIHLELWRRQVEMLNLVAQATLNSIIKRSQDPKRCNMAGKCSIRGGFNWKIICIYIYVCMYV